jgi:hypothetical protein
VKGIAQINLLSVNPKNHVRPLMTKVNLRRLRAHFFFCQARQVMARRAGCSCSPFVVLLRKSRTVRM